MRSAESVPRALHSSRFFTRGAEVRGGHGHGTFEVGERKFLSVIAGTTASEFVANGVKDGRLTLEHVAKYNAEVEKAGISDGRVAPAIIPNYTEPEVRERQLTAHYVGNLR